MVIRWQISLDMLISAGINVAFTTAYHQSIRKQGYCHQCDCGGRAKRPISVQSSSSVLFASDESRGERNINFLTHDKDCDDVTSINSSNNSRSPVLIHKSWADIGPNLKRVIAMRRRRNRRGIPRTKNISQHAINSLARLGRECCFASAFLLMVFHRIATSSSSQKSLSRFMTTNLTRWIAVSFFVKLLNLQSQITASDQSTENIDDDWFLKGKYHVRSQENIFDKDTANNSSKVRIRQVPSDGSCLFHAIGATLLHEEMVPESQEMENTDFTRYHPSMSRVVEYSSKLREIAVDALESNPEKLFIVNQDEEPITASSLVELAAQQYGIPGKEYLTSMREESVWGGGPEIISLALELKRQIVVLEPISEDAGNAAHFLQIRARFGEALPSDYGGTVIYILCAGQNYPGDATMADGNHFFAVFPFKIF